MPELPDITLYVEHLERRLRDARLNRAWVPSPHLLRTVDPPLESAIGRRVGGVERLGKRVVLGFEGDLFLVFHLMIAGRFAWQPAPATAPWPRRPPRSLLGRFEFTSGTLSLTEASTRQRAALHVASGRAALAALAPGGLEVLEATAEAFEAALRREDHTVKRALTDPRIFSGIGNAFSDEILHAARLSPFQRTTALDTDEVKRLFEATTGVLRTWVERLRRESGERFPTRVSAFKAGMAVHGRYRQPCPVCGAPVQRIVHAEHETNYCPRCQTGGRVLRDRALSRLLRDDWPRTLEELERL